MRRLLCQGYFRRRCIGINRVLTSAAPHLTEVFGSPNGAGGGTRTPTWLPIPDFEYDIEYTQHIDFNYFYS